MKNKKLVHLTIILVICFVIAITFLAGIPLQQTIVFEPNHSNQKLAFIPIKDEKQFKIKYTHSIHLSDVIESYHITPRQLIRQVELEYEDFSIGMPSNAEEGETFEQKSGKYYIRNMKRIFPYFYLRIGQVRANHRVIYKNTEYPLSHSIKPGTSVKVEIRRLTLLEQWKGVNILESL
ncbi:DUF1850 domain-containing protein [Bacillus sp. S3]|uniref:DUF1850 domain-containing protein n=1 Tax=Bacillus sp. S3 TaxID=486398 RepID=UPI00118D183B|nr:DUF1850 domain-containing protein [Bacillus sp. S3]QCJ42835.1 DUF1850 domain-containing protein [Bacillus sp. S3]